MARTATVAAPSGLAAPSLVIYDAAGSPSDTISLSLVGTTTTQYRGTIVLATPGNYHVELKDGSDVIGAWDDVPVTGVDLENVIVRDPSNDIDGIHVGQQYTRTNQAGDTLTETIVES